MANGLKPIGDSVKVIIEKLKKEREERKRKKNKPIRTQPKLPGMKKGGKITQKDIDKTEEGVMIVLEKKANIVGYACLIDRSKGKSFVKGKIVSQVELNIPTYTKENLPNNLLALKAVKPGSRNL